MVSSGNVVALTFNAGANADWVASILATLERTCTPATFFLTGRWVEQFQDQARRIAVRHPPATTPTPTRPCRRSSPSSSGAATGS